MLPGMPDASSFILYAMKFSFGTSKDGFRPNLLAGKYPAFV